MSSTNTYSMSELLDQTVERLPFLRRKVAQRRLRNDKYRAALLTELCLKCCDDSEVSEILGVPTCSGLMSGAITATDKFSIDPDKLERLFQILIEYLPKLLEIILPLFMQTILFVLAMTIFSSGLNAQQCDPATGQCTPVKNLLSATAEVAGKTLSAVGAAITPNSVPLPTQYGQTYSIPASQSCNCSQSTTPVQSYNWYPVAASTPTTSVSGWSKSWHKVHGQPARNLGRRIFGR